MSKKVNPKPLNTRISGLPLAIGLHARVSLMVKALGINNWRRLVLFLAMVVLVAITPLGREATAAPVLVTYRLLLITITLLALAELRNREEPDVCPIFVAGCAAVIGLMLLSIIWNPGSPFDGFYRWY